jgi:hypothetical protein
MLLQKMKDVLNDYHKEYSDYQVEKLLESWAVAKAPLISILQKHQNWNHELKCIVLTYKESRNNLQRFSKFKDLEEYITSKMTLPDETLKIINEFYASDLTQFIDGSLVSCINNISATFGFKEGQKTSRALNKIFTTVGANKLPEYNRLFAQFADSVNPLIIDRVAVLSVNPIDYLLMSNGTGWKSCHNLDDGCYQAGTMSYMCDGTSMIFFTSENDEEDVQLAEKITREVFCYSNGKLLQSRLYPDCSNEETKQNYRQIVQQIFSDCLCLPNIWRLEKNFDIVLENTETNIDSLHYSDYTYSHYNPNISFIKDFEGNDEKIFIGSSSYCIECGEKLFDAGYLSCCSAGYKCDDCGRSVHEDDVIWIGDSHYCSNCVSYCDRCGEYTRQSITEVAGKYDYVCSNCLEDYYTYCEDCEIYYPNDDTFFIEAEDKYVCDSCLATNYFYCDSCHQYYNNSHKKDHKEQHYCEECFEELDIEEGAC